MQELSELGHQFLQCIHPWIEYTKYHVTEFLSHTTNAAVAVGGGMGALVCGALRLFR